MAKKSKVRNGDTVIETFTEELGRGAKLLPTERFTQQDLLSANGDLEAERKRKGGQELRNLIINPLNMRRVLFFVVGTAPMMQLAFGMKPRIKIQKKHEEGSTGKSKRVREARNFDADLEQAIHYFSDGRIGFPASAIRNACISACRTADFKMTHAKQSVFAIAEGYAALDGTPLIEIHGGYKKTIMPVRNATGVADLRVRPMWQEWYSYITLEWDGDVFSTQDVVNLLMRAGAKVGIGEGRPDSKNSAGMGYGTFRIVATPEEHAAIVKRLGKSSYNVDKATSSPKRKKAATSGK